MVLSKVYIIFQTISHVVIFYATENKLQIFRSIFFFRCFDQLNRIRFERKMQFFPLQKCSNWISSTDWENDFLVKQTDIYLKLHFPCFTEYFTHPQRNRNIRNEILIFFACSSRCRCICDIFDRVCVWLLSSIKNPVSAISPLSSILRGANRIRFIVYRFHAF